MEETKKVAKKPTKKVIEKQDIDKLELMARSLKDAVKLGENVLADGKVSFSDVAYIGPLVKILVNMAKAIKAYKEMGAEIKDIDGDEAKRLLEIILGK